MTNDYLSVEDTGCEVAPSCLECPLPKCKYDVQPWRGNSTKHQIYATIWSLRKNGVSVREICRQYKISERTVHRVMEQGGVFTGKERPLPDIPGKPISELTEIIKPSAPISLRQPAPTIYMKSCRKCSGDVQWFGPGEMSCIQCGFNQQQPKAVGA